MELILSNFKLWSVVRPLRQVYPIEPLRERRVYRLGRFKNSSAVEKTVRGSVPLLLLGCIHFTRGKKWGIESVAVVENDCALGESCLPPPTCQSNPPVTFKSKISAPLKTLRFLYNAENSLPTNWLDF